MAVPSNRVQLSGLARKLVKAGIIQEQTALDASHAAVGKRVPFVRYLVDQGLAKPDELASAAAEEFGVPLLDIDAIEVDRDITKLVSEDLINKHHALPIFQRGNRLYLAMADPTNLIALDEIKFAVGKNTEAVVVEADKLSRAIDRALADADTGLGDMADDDLDDLEGLEVAQERRDDDLDSADIDDAPVVKFVNRVLLDAIKRGASDLHFEPYEKFYRVRFRIDGVLQDIAKPPLGLASKITARIKVMSRLDVSERRVPQDGRIKLKISKNKAIDFRVSTCPTLYGEKTVMRILDSDASKLNIDDLGYDEDQKTIFLKNLHKPYGMFLVTGPTGSGKTVSLYSGINLLNKVEINISTAEDPVEINLPGINQVQVDERTGMTFPKALRAFLRQDPDVILVGEIRDLETASIAVKAAQTGHMVMSTLHTNDGPQTLTRLQDMGIPPFAVATSINLISAQRLARRLHPDHRQPSDLPPEGQLAEGFSQEEVDEGIKIFEPREGDPDCPSGYKGRVGLYQVMPITDSLKRLIIEGANAVQLADQARAEGVRDIRRSGLDKVKLGVTSIAEVNRVTVE